MPHTSFDGRLHSVRVFFSHTLSLCVCMWMCIFVFFYICCCCFSRSEHLKVIVCDLDLLLPINISDLFSKFPIEWIVIMYLYPVCVYVPFEKYIDELFEWLNIEHTHNRYQSITTYETNMMLMMMIVLRK